MSNQYGPRIVTDGLVLCLDAGNNKSYPGSGTAWTDLSGNSNNGTLTNGPTYSSNNKGVIVLDGSNDYISIQKNNVFNFGTADFAICTWIYPTSLAGSPTIFLGTQYYVANGILLYIDPAGKISVYTTSSFSENVASIVINRWYYIVWTRISGISYIYNNMVLRDSRAFTFNISINNAIVYGYDAQYAGDALKGYISHATVYSGKGLSYSEAIQNYNATKGRFNL